MEAEKEHPAEQVTEKPVEQATAPVEQKEAVENIKEKGEKDIARDSQHSPELTKPDLAIVNKAPAKPGFGKNLGSFLKANLPFFIVMAKGALPPTIILSMYQSDAIAEMLGSLGYLSATISILSLAMLPRAKFFQGFWLSCIFAGFSIAIGGLVSYCAVQARLHTSAPLPASTGSGNAAATATLLSVPYNSSSAAVSAVWLFFLAFVGTLVRVHFPQAITSGMLFNILLIVACSNAPHFPNQTVANNFLASLCKAVYLGLGIGFGVSVVVVPLAVKTLVIKQFAGLLMGIKGALNAYKNLIHTLGNEEALAQAFLVTKDTLPAVAGVINAMNSVSAANSKLQVDIPFAKREVGIDKFGPAELKGINKYVRTILIPLLGLNSVADVMAHFAKARGWTPDMKLDEKKQALRNKVISEWALNMRLVKGPIDKIVDIMSEAIDHIMIQLGMKPRPKKAPDVENVTDGDAPGEPGFAGRLDRVSTEFYSTKHITLIEWAKMRGIDLPDDFFDHPATAPISLSKEISNETVEQHQASQRQLYMLLYMEYLLHATSRGLLDFVNYADSLVAERKLRTRLIVPPIRYLSKIFLNVFKKDNLSNVDSATIRDINEGADRVYMGASYGKRRNPEHLPPTNAWERFGEFIRKIAVFFRDPNTAFAFRVAAATISCSIPVFLHQTFKWSLENRVYWASIMTAISMTPTSGQSLFGFTLRVLGTVAAMLLSWVIYYVAGNGNTVGILVLFWFVLACLYWIPVKVPQFTQIGIITIVTITLTIGYELEGRKIGKAKLGSSGGTYLDILHFGPIRLATVLAGVSIAFFWTIFPYPISEHSALRRDLGGALYILADFYSVVHETVTSRVKGDAGDEEDKTSVGYKLNKARLKSYNKLIFVINELKTYLQFSKFELQIGGKFPRAKYATIIECIEKISRYMALISYTSKTYAETYVKVEDGDLSQWSSDFRRLMRQINPTTHETVMLLTMLSSCILDGRPLPPYVPRPSAYSLSERLEQMDPQILSVRHVNEKGYAAFAVMQLAARCIGSDIGILLDAMKDIVGTMDYSYEVVPESDPDLEVEEDGQKKSTFEVGGNTGTLGGF